MRYSDDELLKMVGEERKRSIGFGEGDTGTLSKDREKALKYYQGDVSADVPAMANRSAAVSTDVAEAIETALPDLVEIFIGGDDVATFQPNSAEDEQSAEDESAYVKQVVFSENDGFTTFNTAFKDALLTKTGIFHWWWEEEEVEEKVATVPQDVAAIAEQEGLAEAGEADEQGNVALTRKVMKSKVCVRAVPPEDFTVAPDAISLRDATYCAMRDRPRVQDLIARGVDAETARGLKSYTQPDQTVSLARDQAGEQTLTADDATGDLRQVEVRSHYIRLITEDGGKLEVWRVETDSEETQMIGKPEKLVGVPFGAITPYLNAHRFYGESVADKLLEVQRIKTTLWRMHLDSGYFALNQRNQVDMTYANEYTIADLLNNVPNMPVRTKGLAVTPLTTGGLQFDALQSIEFASTVGEQRTGIVRNAQGLNPDTLHDTAKGAMTLMTAAMKRIRYIARQFAETGVRDLYVGVHAMLRAGYGGELSEGAQRAKPKLRKGPKQWADIDPSNWPERTGVDVQVGVGSAGREHDLMVMTEIMGAQEKMAMGGLMGVTVTPENIYNAAIRFAQIANQKGPERFFADPAQQPPQPPKQDPEMVKAQGQLQLEQAKAQGQMQLSQTQGEAQVQLEREKGQAKLQTDAMIAQNDHELAMNKLTAEMELKRYQVDAELELKRQQLAAELELKRELGFAQAAVTREVGHAKVSASTSQVEPGGEPG